MEMSMLNLSGLGGLLLLALDIWALVSIFGSSASTGRKVLWSLLVFLLPLVGFLIWLVAGPRAEPRHV
ncbi:PLD nuclease N-terminal domain-containing protein [Seohaeicola nanhaiensis]|uniref:PLD nuclease N-terminal domain-containing protein n=1 Tax=Seohaeicola nanhaiensis TaxID=1387282 RepID=A0ABV9KDJ3_9RHOB